MQYKLMLFAAMLLAFVSANATTRTLNANSNSPGQFTTFQGAQDASSPGDTILVSGGIDYGTITISTPLVIIGTGWFPQNQDSTTSTFDNIYLTTGSSGSTLMGLVVGTIGFSNNATVTTCTIRRCEIQSSIYINDDDVSTSDFKIEECFFANVANDLIISYVPANSNWQIKNCIFNGYVNLNQNGVTNFIFDHCLFLGNIDVGGGNPFYGTTFSNCIFYRTSPTATSVTPTAIFNNCLSYQCTVGNGNAFPSGSVGCVTNVNPQFANFPLTGNYFSYNSSFNFAISPTSPAHNTGTDGTDLGVTGGGSGVYWNTYGIPLIPQVNYINVSTPVVSPGANVQFQFKSYVPH